MSLKTVELWNLYFIQYTIPKAVNYIIFYFIYTTPFSLLGNQSEICHSLPLHKNTVS